MFLLVASIIFVPGAMAAGQATPDEAKAMAFRAAECLKAVGPERALREFSARDGPWHDRDLDVTVEDGKSIMVAHGTNPGLVGRWLVDLKDVDGESFTREMLAITDAGWVRFKWQNPLTKAVEPKMAYEVRVGDYVVGVGAYAA